MSVNRVRLGFLSLTGVSDTGDDRAYLEWHAMDHMPEQYSLPGMLNGQRWRSTAACRRERAAEHDDLAPVENAVCYLLGDPPVPTLEDFMALGQTLADLGRYPEVIPSRFLGAFEVLEARAARRVLVSDEVVPWRPNRGIYLIVERITDRAGATGFLRDVHCQGIPDLLDVPGVAGAWWFGTTPRYRHPTFTKGNFRTTICYLDDEPAVVAAPGGRGPLGRQRARAVAGRAVRVGHPMELATIPGRTGGLTWSSVCGFPTSVPWPVASSSASSALLPRRLVSARCGRSTTW